MIGSRHVPRIPRAAAWYVVAMALVLLLVVGMVRISIPTRTVVRIAPWVSDPAGEANPIAVQLGRVPLAIVASTGQDVIRRIDLYTSVKGVGLPPDLHASLRDDETGRELARTDIIAGNVVDDGLTIVSFKAYPATPRVRIELTANSAISGSSVIHLRGLRSRIPGFSIQSGQLPRAVVGVAIRSYGFEPAAGSRLAIMYDRTIRRWPHWDRTIIPVATLAAGLMILSVAAGMTGLILVTGNWRQRLGSTAIVGLMLIPLIWYVLTQRTS